ncbi:MAG: sulfurtransferase complex subunit TusB [Rhodospirillales bacterium]|nr:sulfurtransferase complex subunit TusB [Rhodospirillales bacterium]MCW8862396.1 sulfurtransferase complex subunit TusB [Rhodospirillales bacterium]MCW8952076.1 sulfurtransferase complex subunit TusB [Rhodospirillales bacterium]MCW8969781.1 sulfurtransferase complex subunit TusB [Rhodospirillales bacterium]MCW9002958.1 sulfurtransferase complex subunit TusB [Rhodospirillales bacterium]
MLHTVNKSPFERNALESCLRLAKKGSAIILFEDGVYGAMAGTAKSDMVASRTGDYEFYVLGPDLAARGIAEDQIIGGVKVVDYGGFVDLAADKGTVQSWL